MTHACTSPRLPPLLEPLEPRLLLSGEAGDAVYLLITSEALKQAFQPLVDRRTGQGKQGELVTTETIEATYPGTDLQERIRNCVIDHYQNHGTVFVALGGDDTVVPVRYCWAREKNCPADLYYADMDGGNWDADGDGVYGEAGDVTVVELTPEICPGRIPVRTPDQAAAYICKVVAYEDASPDGFANSMIIFSASGSVSGEDRPLDFRDYDPVCSGEAKWTQFYWEEIQPYWQATPRHRFTRCYTSWDEGAGGDYPLTAQNLTAKLNCGYHYVVYTGHAGPRHYCLEDSAFHASDAASLTNATRPSIVISGGCSAAYYDWPEDPAMGEAFVRNPNGGAVVFLGYARSVFTGIHMEQLQREIFQNGHRVIGEAFAHCMAAMAPELNLYHQYIYTLLGDPAITLLGEESGRHLQIASPAGCEVIDTDSNLTIRWNASGTGWSPDEKVNLEYSDDGGTTWVPVPGAEALPFNGRLFAWECPRLAQGNGYRVRVTAVSDPAVTDESRTDFTIHDLGVLTVQSAPVRNVTVAGSHAGTTDYTFSAMVGGPVELTTPQEVGDLTFARWTDGAGTVLSHEAAFRFTFAGDATVVAEYEYAHPISQYYYVNDEIPESGIAPGDDANDGLTPQAPMRHIQALLDRYPDIGWGCAVHVSAGVYSESLMLGAEHTGLTVDGSGADVTRIDAGGLGRCLSLDGLAAGTVRGITFTGGQASDGAALRCTNASPSITDCAFVGNQADNCGGAMCIEGDSVPRISRCAFGENRADRGGAVWSREWAAPRFELCTFVGNQSRGNGGAVLNTGYCSVVLEDCVLTGNQSTTFGGAMACEDNSAALVANCTFSGNVADDGGGAICVRDSAIGGVTNCIFWGNTSKRGNEFRVRHSSTMTIGFCDVAGGLAGVSRDSTATLDWGEGNFDADPVFFRDPDDGGDGWGTGGNDDYGDLHLRTGSPCIDAGDANGDYVARTDIDRQERVLGECVDVGADEFPSVQTWAGRTDDHWENAANWSEEVTPDRAFAAAFDQAAAYRPTLYRDERVMGVDFRTAGWVVDGSNHTLTVGTGGIDSAGAGENSVRPSITLAADSTWTVGPGNILILHGSLSGGGRALTKDGPGALGLSGAQDHASGLAMDIGAGKVEFAPGGGTLVLGGLSIAAAGAALDLTNNDLILDYDGGIPYEPSPELGSIKQWIAAGYDWMLWTGNGITSSAAAVDPITYGLGYAQNDMLFLPYDVFSGVPVDSSCILVKYTYNGDLNLDGCVDDNDVTFFNLFYDGGITTSHYWSQGDIWGYDGRVDDNDVTILGLTYGLGIGDPLAAAISAADVPGAVGAVVPVAALPVLMTEAAIETELLVEEVDVLAHAQAASPRQAPLASASAAGGADAAPPARMAGSGATVGSAFLPSRGTSEADEPTLVLLAATGTSLAWSTAAEVAPPPDAVLSPDGGVEDLLWLPALEITPR